MLNPSLFDEMVDIDGDTCINCTWSYTCPGEVDILNTHFLFVNVDVIRAIRKRGFRTSPCTYNYRGNYLGRSMRRAYSRKPTRSEIGIAGSILPLGQDGLPIYPSNNEAKFDFACFDTLTLYQIVCQYFGYKLKKVRNLSGVSATKGHYSNELIHVNGLSYYDTFEGHKNEVFRQFHNMIIQFDYLVLDHMCRTQVMPASYEDRRMGMCKKLGEMGIDEGQCVLVIADYFMNKEISETVFAAEPWCGLWKGREAGSLSVKQGEKIV